jgi:uncharacterized protein involved in exopolysaccharide biosynthesis
MILVTTSQESVRFSPHWGDLVFGGKRMILATALASTSLAAIVSFILPKTYTATARILSIRDGADRLAALAGASPSRSADANVMVATLQPRLQSTRAI